MGKLKFVLFGFAMSIVWVFLTSFLLVYLGYNEIPREEVEYKPFWYMAFFSCIWAPLWEEAVYRWVPIQIAKRKFPELLWPLIIFSSGFFGWGHGDCQEGVLIQGVIGLIFSWVYLKTGSIWYSILLHSIYNSIFVFGPIWLSDNLVLTFP